MVGTMLVCASCSIFVRALGAQVATDTLADPLPTATALAHLPPLGSAVGREYPTAPRTLLPVTWSGSASVSPILLTPRSIAGIVRDDSLDAHLRGCMPTMDTSYRPRHPWARLDSATIDRAFVLVQVGLLLPAATSCRYATNPRVRGAGLQIVEPNATVRLVDDVTGAAVIVDGRPLAPALVARARSAAFDTTGSPLRMLPLDLRVYLAPDALAPDRRGRFPEVDLWLTSADTARRPSELPLSDTAVAHAWSELTPWRLSRLDGRPHAATLPRLRTPSDSTLRRAAAMYAAGELVPAAMLAAHEREQLDRPSRTTADARFADLLVGSVFAAYGDSAGTRAEYAQALRSAPCLRLANHPAFDAQLDPLRPAGVRCQSVSTVRQLGAGLLLPGGAQWVRGDRFLAGIAAAATTTLFVIAAQRAQDAQQQYDAYRAAVDAQPITMAAMLASANATRASARAYVLRAASVWAGSAVVGLLQEAVHARRVRGEQEYEPVVGDGGLTR